MSYLPYLVVYMCSFENPWGFLVACDRLARGQGLEHLSLDCLEPCVAAPYFGIVNRQPGL